MLQGLEYTELAVINSFIFSLILAKISDDYLLEATDCPITTDFHSDHVDSNYTTNNEQTEIVTTSSEQTEILTTTSSEQTEILTTTSNRQTEILTTSDKQTEILTITSDAQTEILTRL